MSNLVEPVTSQASPARPATAQTQWGTTSANVPAFAVAQAPAPGPVVSVSNEGANKGSRFKETKTRIQVMFEGQMNKMTTNKIPKTISTPAAAQNIFKHDSGRAPHDIHHASDGTTNQAPRLEKGIITGISVRSTHNDFPTPLKFDFTGQGEVAGCFSLDGKQFPLALYPGESHRGINDVIFSAKNVIDDPILKRYGHVTIEDLKEGIQFFKHDAIAYVPLTNDVVRIIQLNPEKFGPAPTQADVRDGKYYKMDSARVNKVLEELHFNIINRLKFTDLSKFSVTMARMDDRTFNDFEGTQWSHYDAEERNLIGNKLCHAGFELEISWACPQQEAPVSSPSPVTHQAYQAQPSWAQKVPVSTPTGN